MSPRSSRRSSRCAALALAVAAGVAPAAAQEPAGWPTLAGTGLFTLPSTATLARGDVSVSANVDNRDRDPLGLDLFDGAAVAVAGLGRRAEAYGHAIVSRVASLPEPPPLPAAPLDLVVAPGAAAPAPPFHSFYSPTPYVDKRGSARFDAFVPGDVALGLKMRLIDGDGARPGVAVGAELKRPLTRDAADLRSGSGTGGTDLRLRAVAGWSLGTTELLATAAYTRTGDGRLGDRLVRVAGGTAVAEDQPLRLADRILLGAGARRALGRSLALVAEVSAERDVGARTAVLDTATPVDVLAGVQARLAGARLAAALRYHGNALPSGARRASPLAGLVDVTDVSAADLAAYFERIGAATALPLLRAGTHRAVAAPPGVALPPGARRLPAEYVIRSEHQVGFLIVLGWTF